MPLFQYRGDGPVVLQMTHAPLVNNYDPSVYDLDIINKDFAKWRESTLWNRFKPHKIKMYFKSTGIIVLVVFYGIVINIQWVYIAKVIFQKCMGSMY